MTKHLTSDDVYSVDGDSDELLSDRARLHMAGSVCVFGVKIKENYDQRRTARVVNGKNCIIVDCGPCIEVFLSSSHLPNRADFGSRDCTHIRNDSLCKFRAF
jgi:hypothetical protein